MKDIFTTHAVGIAGVALVLLLPSVVLAETVLRTGESVSIEANQAVENDFYVAAGTVSVSGSVAGDMYAAAGSMTANGSIGEDVTVAAGSAQIHASTSDDVRVLAGETVIANSVGGDVFVIGGILHILSTASIAGDVFFYGGEAEINGPVAGSVMGGAEALTVNAQIGGDVDVVISRALTLHDSASVGGDVRYKGVSDITRSQGAVVEGDVIQRSQTNADQTDSASEKKLIALFITLFAAIASYLVLQRNVQSFVTGTIMNPARSAGVGLATIIGAPIISLVLLLTVVVLLFTPLGVLLGSLLLFTYLVLIGIAYVMMHILAGGVLAYVFTKRTDVRVSWIVAGTAFLQIMLQLPLIGPFVIFIFFTMTIGGLTFGLYQIFSRNS